ncbi:flagellar export chaperone FliS [Candidatus Paraluminiphilus aquimaris]|uniref:Flagellar secretion chaperone FliS n=1 Tax=Candidatus Paraluminiphilus aquimaris TaxID=2518994 RepID=A0ABY6Q556_9GAMM|nr:flagellar export chaperone FliS [Candidatus Paraluminiphilus aquimaris]UZP73796.1 flagellar export chaperone FliS [Candidatus Paraluminiphilus aquimaris]
MTQAALAAYGEVKVHSAIEGASPTELISMLFDGVSSRLNQSLTAIESGDIPKKGELISQTISILEYLTAVLDEHKAQEVADNLSGLYRYMVTTLLSANINNDTTAIKEVISLMTEVRDAWSEMMKNEAAQ